MASSGLVGVSAQTRRAGRSARHRRNQRVQQVPLHDGPHHFRRHHRRLLVDHRELGDLIFAQQGDGLGHGLARVRVHELGNFAALPGQDVTDQRLAGLRGQEAVVRHPVVVEDLGKVAAAAIGKQHNDHIAGPRAARGAEPGRDREAARTADEQRLLAGQPAGHQEGLRIGDRDDLVTDGPVVGVRPDVLANPLDQVGTARATRIHRALRVRADHPDPSPGHVLQIPARAADGPAGADPGHEVGDPPVGLGPDLRAGRGVVRRGVLRVGVLVRLPAAGQFGRHPARHAVVRIGVRGRDRTRARNDVGAVGAQHAELVLGHLVRADENAFVAALGGDDGQPDSGVPRRRLDDRPARPELPGRLGRLDHAQGDPVLDRAARVEILHLREDVGPGARQAQIPCDLAQPDQRRVTHRLSQGIVYLHARRDSFVARANGPSGPGLMDLLAAVDVIRRPARSVRPCWDDIGY